MQSCVYLSKFPLHLLKTFSVRLLPLLLHRNGSCWGQQRPPYCQIWWSVLSPYFIWFSRIWQCDHILTFKYLLCLESRPSHLSGCPSPSRTTLSQSPLLPSFISLSSEHWRLELRPWKNCLFHLHSFLRGLSLSQSPTIGQQIPNIYVQPFPWTHWYLNNIPLGGPIGISTVSWP